MIFRSIRWRLQIWHGLMMVGVLIGFGVTAYQLERATRMHQVDQELEVRQKNLRQSLREGSREGPPDGPPGRRGDAPPPRHELHLPPHLSRYFSKENSPAYYGVIWTRYGQESGRSDTAPPDVPTPDGARPEAGTITRTRGTVREAYSATPPGEVVLAGRSIAPELAALRSFALGLLAVGGGVLGIGLAGGWFLVSRVIRPIDAISDTAGRIAAGNLSERIRTEEPGSELGRLAAVLNDTFARLDDAFAQQRQFTADASHELRTPVSVILSQTQATLARPRSPEEYRATLEACQRSAQRMRRLITSLLELARLDAGQDPMERQKFDLSKIVADALELVGPLGEERSVRWTTDLSSAPCTGDAEKITQVVTNLLTNAIHHNRDQGEVRVSVRAEEGGAVLTVADTGVGIAEADLPHVFRRFFRADKARSHGDGRTGLGLAICQAIVDAHQGRLSVTSRPGAGSTFTLRLPAA